MVSSNSGPIIFSLEGNNLYQLWETVQRLICALDVG